MAGELLGGSWKDCESVSKSSLAVVMLMLLLQDESLKVSGKRLCAELFPWLVYSKQKRFEKARQLVIILHCTNELFMMAEAPYVTCNQDPAGSSY